MAHNHPTWDTKDITDQSGKTMIVTGANSGIGFEMARALAAKGAKVILACRNAQKGEDAAHRIAAEKLSGHAEFMALDLASLDSVRAFATAFLSRHNALHVLCNNAGVMALPYRRTADGFEMQFGTNHVGHFALTGLLVERFISTPQARVVTVSSSVHQIGAIRFDNLHWERGYQRWLAYGRSKLANLLFTYELQRRFAAHGTSTISIAAHPGYAATNLQYGKAELQGAVLRKWLFSLSNRTFAQSAAMGALPLLYAAVAPEVQGGDYIGPDGFMEQRGYPTKVRSNRRSYDQAVAAQLWQVSEQMTGVRFLDGPAASTASADA